MLFTLDGAIQTQICGVHPSLEDAQMAVPVAVRWEAQGAENGDPYLARYYGYPEPFHGDGEHHWVVEVFEMRVNVVVWGHGPGNTTGEGDRP